MINDTVTAKRKARLAYAKKIAKHLEYIGWEVSSNSCVCYTCSRKSYAPANYCVKCGGKMRKVISKTGVDEICEALEVAGL